MADVDEAPGPTASTRLRLWPWTAKAALLTVPVALVALLIGFATTTSLGGWPADQYQGWTLLVLVLLSLMPILLLVLQTLTETGGTLEVPGGVKLSFATASARAASTVSTATLAENLGTVEGEPIGATSMRSILRALRDSQRTDVTVVDLREGQTWWESRLFILIAAAANRRDKQALAFVATRNGVPRTFIGWADPVSLLELHLAAQPQMATAYLSANASSLQWQIGKPAPGPVPSVTVPWSPTQAQHLPFMADEAPDPKFAFELFLQKELDAPGETTDVRRHVTIRRLLDLFEPVLVSDHVDAQATDEDWVRLLTAHPRRFFAMTSSGVLRALVPRDALVAAVLAVLVQPLQRSAANQSRRLAPGLRSSGTK